jgi:hypothetical protein
MAIILQEIADGLRALRICLIAGCRPYVGTDTVTIRQIPISGKTVAGVAENATGSTPSSRIVEEMLMGSRPDNVVEAVREMWERTA